MTTSVKGEKSFKPYLAPTECIQAFKEVLLSRYMDDKMKKLVRQNKGGSFQLSSAGHELIGVLSARALKKKTDWGFPYYRDRPFSIGLGCSLKDLLGAFLSRAVPHHSGGRMMPDHFSEKGLRIPVQSSCVGSQFLQAVGTALSAKMRGETEVVYVSGGDGSTSQGDFYEALNFSCLHNLPVIFVIQDNGWAISTPRFEQTTGNCISKIASGYENLSTHVVNGSDYVETAEALHHSVERAREKMGPSLIVAKIPRIGPHSSSDDPKKYKTDRDTEQDVKNDPIAHFESWLLEMKMINESDLADLKKSCFELIESAAKDAEMIPFPEKDTASTKVYKEYSLPRVKKEDGATVVMMDALNHALTEEMERDEGVVIFGQDVARGKGGVFGITRTLTEKFGPNRCFNTPLAESTIVGVATGLAFDGKHKPVAEIQFTDYAWTGMNQIINELSSIYYRSNGEWNCPVVIRMPYGGYIQGGPYHSQCTESYYSHCPGLKVVIPSNAADAKRLLKSAIRDPNPVIFLEHKALYRQRTFVSRPEPGKDDLLELGCANVVESGSDLTLVTYGMTVMMAHEVVQKLKKEGLSVELIDLRTIVPFDRETVSNSIKKTGKLLILHEAAKTSGFGSEIAAQIMEENFAYLDAPICRLAANDTPVPYAKDLEDETLPQKEDIEEKIRKLAAY